ncbi:nucleoside diphosphate kinase regulator [Marinobacter salicampi]|uniref:nucleoside diphosphate kinase regulator n=1 Tax=Marinobacter salicampi TaxID=435907 RepID=UPI001F5F8C6C|nr:nucleoside diphosphate kinase regulator [Marinobacter salicampi]
MPAIVIAVEDYDRLSALLDSADSEDETVESLEEELSRANLVKRAELPPDVVTMNSRVRFRNETTGDEHEMVLVYPNELQGGAGRISVLAPAGAALLGLTVGDVIDWPMQGRKPLQIKILGVTHSHSLAPGP